MVLFLMLPAVYLSLLHGLFVGSVRYRLGATPMMEMLAAWFVVTAYDSLRRDAKPEGECRKEVGLYKALKRCSALY